MRPSGWDASSTCDDRANPLAGVGFPVNGHKPMSSLPSAAEPDMLGAETEPVVKECKGVNADAR